MADPNAVANGRKLGIDEEHYRDYQLLRLGIGPAEALDLPAHKLDWLLYIHSVMVKGSGDG